MPPPVPQVTALRPKPTHIQKFHGNKIESFSRHVSRDRPHFHVSRARIMEPARPSIVGKARYCSETISRKKLGVWQCCFHPRFPFWKFPRSKFRHSLVPGNRNCPSMGLDEPMSGIPLEPAGGYHSLNHRISD